MQGSPSRKLHGSGVGGSVTEGASVSGSAAAQSARAAGGRPGRPPARVHFAVIAVGAVLTLCNALAPLVFVAWWGGGIALLGDRPVLWKLWTFPFAWLLAASVASLARRAAPGFEVPLLLLALLSPAVLPSSKLMLDLPVLALGLCALVLMLRAVEQDRLGPALLSGVAAGLALETKYNGVVYLAVALLCAAQARRWRMILASGLPALGLFAGFEAFADWRYGESPFLHALLEKTPGQDPTKPLGLWALALLSILGATAPALGLLSLVVLGASRRAVAGAMALVAVVFVALPLLPRDSFAVARSSLPVLAAPRPELLAFAPLGLLVTVALGAALARLAGRVRVGAPGAGSFDRLLLAWVALEVVGFFAVSPFPAVRRTLGLDVALLLVCARLLSAAGPRRELSRRLRPVLAFGVALGVLYQAASLADASARREAVPRTMRELERLGHDRSRQTVWYSGHWGFQFYAPRHGMRALVPGRSRVRAGDWLVVPEGVDRPPLLGDPGLLDEVAGLEARSALPWSAVPSFHHGPLPLRAQPLAQLRVRIFRVREDFVPGIPRGP
jgi:hypothetical protein